MTPKDSSQQGQWVYCTVSGTEGKKGRRRIFEPFIVGVVLVTFFRCRGDMAKVDCKGHRAHVGASPLSCLLCLAMLLDCRMG